MKQVYVSDCFSASAIYRFYAVELILKRCAEFFNNILEAKTEVFMSEVFCVKTGYFRDSIMFTSLGEILNSLGLVSKKDYKAGKMSLDISIPSNRVNELLIPKSFLERIERMKEMPFLIKASDEIRACFNNRPIRKSDVNLGVGFDVKDLGIGCCNQVNYLENGIENTILPNWPVTHWISYRENGMEDIKDSEALYCCAVALTELMLNKNSMPSDISNLASIGAGSDVCVDFIDEKSKFELTKW